MMKMMMRLDKSQVKTSLRYGSGAAGTWYRDPLIMAGLKSFDFIIVGAGGGRAGQVTYSTDAMYPSGGGGGGAVRRTGALSELPSSGSYSVGIGGGNGTDDSGKTSDAGDGSNGQDTSFCEYYARGGQGAEGGSIRYNIVFYGASEGGFGGGTSTPYGSLGSGGTGGKGDDIEPQNQVNETDPTPGVWEAHATQPGLWGGRGGGGGKGRVKGWTSSGDGSQGHTGGDGLQAATAVDVKNTNRGGGGGGCNIQAVSGISEIYGEGCGSSGTKGQDGILVAKFY